MTNEIRDTRKVWLVPHPTHQFKENIKQLAREKNMRIVDVKFADLFQLDDIATDTPKLTNLTELRAAAEAERAEKATAAAVERQDKLDIKQAEKKAQLEFDAEQKAKAKK